MASERVFLAFAGLLLAISCTGAIPSSRISGGVDAPAGQHPWAASVRIDGRHACMASIIHEKLLVTAAGCVSSLGTTSINSDRVTCRIGSVNQFAGGEIVKVGSIVINPSFGNFLHNIAILKLEKTLEFSDKINKIPLSNDEGEIPEGTAVSVAGWGLQENGSSPYKLQQITLSVLSSQNCENQAGYGYPSVVCLQSPEKQGICSGDYGAGVVSDNKLLCVGSFAFGSCATKYPDICTRISYYASWIEEIVQNA